MCLPEQNKAIDKSLTLWEGCLSFRQSLPLESWKFRLKPSKLCEFMSQYLCVLLLFVCLFCFVCVFFFFLIYKYMDKDTEIRSTYSTPNRAKTVHKYANNCTFAVKRVHIVFGQLQQQPSTGRISKKTHNGLHRDPHSEQENWPVV